MVEWGTLNEQARDIVTLIHSIAETQTFEHGVSEDSALRVAAVATLAALIQLELADLGGN